MTEAEQFMRRAIELAEKGRHRVMPNPLVGCVLVRDGEIVAEGWHDHLGGLHAEQMAIADAESKGIATRGTTAYVTLEPCNHFGRTPPCTESLLWAGVEKIVIGAMDPNPTVRGGGCESLANNGVEVSHGILAEECERQMAEFIHWCKWRRPLVTMKASTDVDGRVDGPQDQPSRRFSSEEAMSRAHQMRADSMAILVGVGTIVRDDPSLTVRGPIISPREPPVRVVLDPNNRIPNQSIVMLDGQAPTLLVQSSDFDDSSDGSHVRRVVIPGPEMEVLTILEMLGDMGIQALLVEGGVKTWSIFLESGLVDRVRTCKSDVSLGPGGKEFDTDMTGHGMSRVSVENIGGDTVSWWE